MGQGTGYMGGLNGLGLEMERIISAHVPLAQMQAYSTALLQSTAGKLAVCRGEKESGFGGQPNSFSHRYEHLG